MVELLGLKLVHREDHRKALAPERQERADERDVAKDPGLVLDEHRIALRRDELELAVEVGRVEMLDPDERDLVPAVAQAIGYRERVVVDAAALVARHHDDLLRLRVRQLPPALGERELEPVGNVRAGECVNPSPAFLDQVLAERLIAHHALELRCHRVRRFLLDQDAAVAERLRYCRGGVRDDRQVAPHRLEERDAEALVLREREERGRAAVIRDQLLDRDGAGERDRVGKTELANVAAHAVQIAPRHRGWPDEVEVRGGVGLAVFGERRDDIVDRLVREDLADGEDRGALVGQRARDLGIGRPVEVLPVHERRHDRGVREPGRFELLAVVLAVCDPELGRFRKLLELLTSELGEGLQIVVEAGEVVTWSDVVIDDRLPRGRRQHLRHGIGTDRVMHKE